MMASGLRVSLFRPFVVLERLPRGIAAGNGMGRTARVHGGTALAEPADRAAVVGMIRQIATCASIA